MREVNDRVNVLAYDDHLSQQIELMEKIREEGRKRIVETQESGSDHPGRSGGTEGRKQRPDPKIVENIQLVPPHDNDTDGDWTTVTKRGRKPERTGRAPPAMIEQRERENGRPKNDSVETRLPRKVRRRPPNTAAVALRSREDGEATYADVLRTAKSGI